MKTKKEINKKIKDIDIKADGLIEAAAMGEDLVLDLAFNRYHQQILRWVLDEEEGE